MEYTITIYDKEGQIAVRYLKLARHEVHQYLPFLVYSLQFEPGVKIEISYNEKEENHG